MIMVAYAIGFALLSGMVLKWWGVGLGTVGAMKSNEEADQKNEDEKQAEVGDEEAKHNEKVARQVEVRLVKFGLDIYKPSVLGVGKAKMLRIIKGVNTVFESGKLNGRFSSI